MRDSYHGREYPSGATDYLYKVRSVWSTCVRYRWLHVAVINVVDTHLVRLVMERNFTYPQAQVAGSNFISPILRIFLKSLQEVARRYGKGRKSEIYCSTSWNSSRRLRWRFPEVYISSLIRSIYFWLAESAPSQQAVDLPPEPTVERQSNRCSG